MENQPTEKLSRKELARQQRRAAYLRAKEYRATDPKQLAFKETMKQRQREANQASKERRKAVAKEQQDQQLIMIVKPATKSE